MTLKSQDTGGYRGLVWVGRLYRFAGWIGLPIALLFAIWVGIEHWRSLTSYTSLEWFDILVRTLLLGGFVLALGMALCAIAFGISLGIQVGLTMMKNSDTQVALLRRIAQQQGEAESVLRLDEGFSTNGALSVEEQPMQQRRK
jgi:hypothetical protein